METKKEVFKNFLGQLLKEDLREDAMEAEADRELDKQAFKDRLDDGTSPEDYDVNPQTFRQISQANVEIATQWVKILEDFAELINDPQNEDSLIKFLNDVDREGSAFRGITRSQGKRATRIAEECSAMAEVISSHIAGSERKQRELMQQFPNLKR